MAQYDLPNGKVLTVPDDLALEQRQALADAVKKDYGIDINETTILGQAKETLKGVPRGAFSMVADVP